MSERDRLVDLTERFLGTFNTNDLDAMMSFFADDGVYEEFNGRTSKGLDEVRATFEPQFSGAFGQMQFLDEDLIVDVETGEVMASWRCTLTVKGEPTSWRGLDVLHWEGDRLTRKLTYAKAKTPLFDR
jgi:uncharacterized protein (TIGR02246 family)